MIDARAFGADVAAMVKDYVEPLVAANDRLREDNAALIKRLEAVEARPVHDLSEIKAMIAAIDIPEVPELPDIGAMIADAVVQGERGEKGEKGDTGVGVAGAVIDREGNLVLTLSDGKAVNLGAVVGKDGEPGRDGVDGAPGRDGVDGAAGRDGIDGKDGEPGRDGLDGKDGEAGRDGIDGIDGKDGLGFDDMSVDYDGERGLMLKWSRGERTIECPVKLPLPIYRGVFASGDTYEKGDCVTWGGSIWIAQEDEPSGSPSEASKSWKLAVKRGRNGKEPVSK